MKLTPPLRKKGELDMTPMIDIIFQLIIFFMIASSFVEEAKVFKVSVPKAGVVETISTEEARVIAVTKDGKVAPSDSTDEKNQYESLLELVADLKQYKEEASEAGKGAVVVIAGDQEAPYQRIIQVWNAIKSAGISQVSFQVEAGTPTEP